MSCVNLIQVKSSNCLIGVVTPAEENEDGSLTNAAQSPMKRGRFEPQVGVFPFLLIVFRAFDYLLMQRCSSGCQ